MDDTASMTQAEDITSTATPGENGFDCILYATITEVAKKGISGTERQKCKTRMIFSGCLRKQAVHNFKGCAIPPNSDEAADAPLVGGSREFGCLSGGTRGGYVDLNSSRFQAIERRSQQLTAAPASRGRINNGEIVLPHDDWSRVLYTVTIADRCADFRISSASTWRLIFMEAVRGKSLSQTR